jgi:hypothetical protein
MHTSWLLAVLAFSLFGCGGGDDDDDTASTQIASGNLTGKVGGASWTLASAQTDAFLSDNDGFWVDLYSEPVASCGAFGSGNSLILRAPTKVGSYPFGPSLNGTFVVDAAGTSDNLIATQGQLRVDEVTSAMLRGGLSMTYDDGNTVSGDFEAVVCAD